MNGQKGLTIVVVALLLTICIGFLFNAEQQPTSKTVYEDHADLSALMALNSSRENLTEVYNSSYNITGWTPSNMIVATETANPYIIEPSTIEFNDVTKTLNFNAPEHLDGRLDITLTPGPSADVTTDGYIYTSTNAKWREGDTYPSGAPFNGGIWARDWPGFRANVYFNEYGEDDTSAGNMRPLMNNGQRLQWDNINRYIDNPPDGLRIYPVGTYGSNVQIVHDLSANIRSNIDRHLGTDVTIYLGARTAKDPSTAQPEDIYYSYNGTTEKWDLYEGDTRIKANVNVFVISTTGDSYNLTTKEPITYPPEYADPTKYVNIPNTGVPTPIEDLPAWSNTAFNPTLINASVSLLVKNSMVIYAAGGTITVDYDGTTYTVNGVNVGNYANGLMLTLDAQTKIVKTQGVLTANATAPATDYTLTNFSYEVGWNNTTAEITKISFRSTNDAQAYIVSTTIYTDPNNLLWINFNVNIENYFSSIITSEAGARVLFNGFVSYGNKLTINGQNFDVADGKITVPYDDGFGERPTQFRLNGMAIDYNRNGTVNLVFTEDKNKTVSLGETANYIIAGSGAWYFSSHVMQIKNIDGMEWVWVGGWTLDVNQTCAVMLGLLVVGLLIGLYFGRGSLDSYDWIILILAAFATFSLMVV